MATSIHIADQLFGTDRPLLMAVVNVTPDSFFARSRATDEASLRQAVEHAVDTGADILDIGACSTRPAVQSGGGQIEELADEQHELERLEWALQLIRRMQVKVPLSVDTFRPAIARHVIKNYGVALINDVSGGTEAMFTLAAEKKVAYVLTYNRSHAQHSTDDIVADALHALSSGADALHRLGVSDVLIDPGFGFGQTVEQSLRLLADMQVLQQIGCPILVGVSRKRMAYEPHGLTPDTCLEQTLDLERQALVRGANILRVHDVAATREMINDYAIK